MLKIPVPPEKKAEYTSITKISWLMLFKEITCCLIREQTELCST
jgi:hypothetical protein